MKKKNMFQSLFFILVFIFSMPIFAETVKELSKTHSIYTEDIQNIIVTKGQTSFTLQLKSNPTTGYSWFLRNYDANLLTPVKHEFQKSNQKLMGASGYEI